MPFNLLCVDLADGTVISSDFLSEPVRKIFLSHPDINFISEPIESFYYVYGIVRNFNWYNAVKDFNTRIKSDIKNGKAQFILSCEQESFGTRSVKDPDSNNFRNYSFSVIDLIKNSAKFFDIDPKCITYSDMNYKIEKSLAEHNLNSVWFNIYETYYEPYDVSSIFNSISNKENRPAKFLYLGGKGRSFRLRFVNELLRIKNFEKDNLISTQSGSFIDVNTKQSIYVPKFVLDFDMTAPLSQEIASSHSYKLHLQAYINIVSNSYFYLFHNHLEISEKFFKPMLCLQPFIILGEYGTLAGLKELGYKTFDKWFDESYDSELDDEERLCKLVKEVKRLNSLTHAQLSDMLLDMLPVLQHNHELLVRRYRDSTPIKTFIDKLTNKYQHDNNN